MVRLVDKIRMGINENNKDKVVKTIIIKEIFALKSKITSSQKKL
jgi:hypothetical protein